MYLIEINLQNIRCFENIQLRFIDDDEKPIMWTVIFGENGTGKSTLLRSIALFLSNRETVLDLLDVSNPVRQGAKSGRGIMKVKLNDESKKEKKLLELGWTIGNTRDGTGSIMGLANDDRYSFDDESETFFLSAYGETRTPSTKPYNELAISISDRKYENIISLFSEGVLLRPVDRMIMNIHYQFNEERESKENRYKSAMHALSKILPGAPKFKKMTQKEEALFVTSNGNLTVGQLSSGFRDVVCLLMDIISRLFDKYPESKDPLKESGIVLIDEISLHLHPRWQKVIISNFRKYLPNIQFIVTTHSPLVAQSLKENEVVTLKQLETKGKKTDIEVVRHNFSPKGLSADQLLTSSIFDLESAKSAEIEGLRRRFRALRKKIIQETATKKQEKEYQKIVDELERFGEAPGDTDMMRKLNLTIQSVISEMGQVDLLERPSLQQLKKLIEELKD